MFYLTHFIYDYIASDIWLRTILIVRKETRCRHIGYSYRLTARVFYMHHPTDRITHTTAFVIPVVEHWLEREITQWVHPMKDRSEDPSHHERTLLPRSYISLPLRDKDKLAMFTEKRNQLFIVALCVKTRTAVTRCLLFTHTETSVNIVARFVKSILFSLQMFFVQSTTLPRSKANIYLFASLLNYINKVNLV